MVSELSRLGRSLYQVMTLLNELMSMNIKVYTVKEGFILGDDINSKVMAFAFSLSAEIERQLISQRTKEGLARVRAEGKRIGRPKGSTSVNKKLQERDREIQELLSKKVSKSAIARIMEVDRGTLNRYLNGRNNRLVHDKSFG